MSWTLEDIEANLRAFLVDRERWPRRIEFEAAGERSLLRAIYRHGGARQWAQRVGVRYPPDRRQPEPLDTWTGADLSHRKTKLAQLRHDAGKSQGALAVLAGLSERTVQRIDAGQRPSTLRQLVNLALALKVPVAALIEETWMDAVALGERPRSDPGPAVSRQGAQHTLADILEPHWLNGAPLRRERRHHPRGRAELS